jgi:hypothetical protein
LGKEVRNDHAKPMANASGRNNEPGIPPMVNAGANTARIHKRISSFGKAISLQASHMARALGLTHVQVLVYILYRYRTLIHQDTDSQRQAAQRHDIDGLSEQVEE